MEQLSQGTAAGRLESGMVMLLIALSEPFAWIVAADQIPQILIDWISHLTTSPYAILLLINVFLLLLASQSKPRRASLS